MFEKLQQKWKVNGWRLLLILVTFALGGSLCGYAGRKLLGLMNIESAFIRVLLYVVLVTLLWPLCVLLISVFTGQFAFFRMYLQKMGKRMMGSRKSEVGSQKSEAGSQKSVRVAVFASGAGSNAQKIIDHFKGSTTVQIALIVCNKPEAGVLDIAKREHIPTLQIEKETFFRGNGYVDELKAAGIDFVVLAGFLWKIPPTLTAAYPNRMVNIHPALLPRYGGKGMYGMHVHTAIIAAGEKESGITIHYVDNVYDNGAIIFQATCAITAEDTPDTLAQKVHQLEHAHYPRIIEQVVHNLQNQR
jgi:formyltetrahydrofolate-dependent phosphoribosylglycinamide formyltransferase